MLQKEERNKTRQQRHLRVRKTIKGVAERPRLNVFRSLNQIYAQIINDENGPTLVAASSNDQEVRQQLAYGGNIAAARAVGTAIAQKAAACGITSVVFDRGGYLYHGRVKALAEAAREAGLNF